VSPGSFFTIQFNVTVKPFDDVRVRQALFYGIDRDEITTAIAPISKRTYGLNPPSFPGGFTAETIPPEVAYNYDPEKAKALLAEAGFPDGFAFKNDTSQREDFSAIMLMIQDQLRRINVDMELNIKDHTAFHADQNIGTNTLSQQSSAMPPVPTQVIVTYLPAEAEVKSDGNGGSNMSHYGVAIPGIDDLLAQALAEPDLQKRIAIVQQIEIKALRCGDPAGLEQRIHDRAVAQGGPRLPRRVRLRELAAVASQVRLILNLMSRATGPGHFAGPWSVERL
jgi:peptide/nickel transport system substrate-binding protein